MCMCSHTQAPMHMPVSRHLGVAASSFPHWASSPFPILWFFKGVLNDLISLCIFKKVKCYKESIFKIKFLYFPVIILIQGYHFVLWTSVCVWLMTIILNQWVFYPVSEGKKKKKKYCGSFVLDSKRKLIKISFENFFPKFRNCQNVEERKESGTEGSFVWECGYLFYKKHWQENFKKKERSTRSSILTNKYWLSFKK